MIGTMLQTVLVLLLAGGLGIWIFGERGRLMRPSSWKGLRAAGLRSLFNLNAVHQYVYGRWTNQYISTLIYRIFPRLDERGRRRWVDRYHGKVLTHEQAEAIVLLDHDLPRRDLEQIIPYPQARDLVLNGPPEVAAYECACRIRPRIFLPASKAYSITIWPSFRPCVIMAKTRPTSRATCVTTFPITAPCGCSLTLLRPGKFSTTCVPVLSLWDAVVR